MEQTVTPLSAADQARLAAQRAVCEAYLGDDASRANYATPAGKVGLLRALLAHGVFRPDQTYELQCLGVVLGDAFVQELGLQWVMVTDEAGRDPAVQVPRTTVLLFPLTMLAKRVERGETVDVFDLFNGVAAQVDELRETGTG
jgi:hypothetical protein